MNDITRMNQEFGIHNHIDFFRGPGNLIMIRMNNDHGNLSLCLQGAQVLEYNPTGQKKVLWLSRKSNYQQGKPIRGGIPICWPWFGDHPDNDSLPAHGFARTSQWTVLSSHGNKNETTLRLALTDNQQTRTLWPYSFSLELEVCLNHQLSLTLTTRNTDTSDLTITEALHSYFTVGDIDHTAVTGLEDQSYLDKIDGLQNKNQTGEVHVKGETDRVYINTDKTTRISDAANRRNIFISKSGSLSTVIWNPGKEKAQAMCDFEDSGYKHMICLETSNALTNTLNIAPGTEHQMGCVIRSDS